MAGREPKKYARTKVTYRLMTSQTNRLNETAKALKKSKTAIIEEALGMYFNLLHKDGVI
jgi:predicted transcriptional regulator